MEERIVRFISALRTGGVRDSVPGFGKLMTL